MSAVRKKGAKWKLHASCFAHETYIPSTSMMYEGPCVRTRLQVFTAAALPRKMLEGTRTYSESA